MELGLKGNYLYRKIFTFPRIQNENKREINSNKRKRQ
jgi:hypothetical protein